MLFMTAKKSQTSFLTWFKTMQGFGSVFGRLIIAPTMEFPPCVFVGADIIRPLSLQALF